MNQSPSLDVSTLRQLNIQVLSQDEKWLDTIGPRMNEDMRILVTRQTALIQEEKQSINQLIQLKRQKKEALKQLLGLTAQLQKNDMGAESQAERIKSLLERINQEVDYLQYRVETVPSEIQKLNLELLEETITLGYYELSADRERISILNLKIQKLRGELLVMNEQKFELEDNASYMGQYLHSLLGKELSDVLDAQYNLNDEEYVL